MKIYENSSMVGLVSHHEDRPIPDGHIAQPFRRDDHGRTLENRTAQKTCAACLQALRHIRGGRTDGPVLDDHQDRRVKLMQPLDLCDSFQRFLDHPALGTDRFSSGKSRPVPGLPDVRAVGDSVTYSIHEIKHAEPGHRRHIVITIDGPKPELERASAGTVERMHRSLRRVGEKLHLATGAPGEMTDFGRALGDWASQLRKADRHVVITIQGANEGAAGAATAFSKSIEYRQAVKLSLYDPVSLSPPDDPVAFAKGVHQLGGIRRLQALAATFFTPAASMQSSNHLPGARILQRLSDATWDPRAFSTVYDSRHATGDNLSNAIGAAYLSQQRKANRTF